MDSLVAQLKAAKKPAQKLQLLGQVDAAIDELAASTMRRHGAMMPLANLLLPALLPLVPREVDPTPEESWKRSFESMPQLAALGPKDADGGQGREIQALAVASVAKLARDPEVARMLVNGGHYTKLRRVMMDCLELGHVIGTPLRLAAARLMNILSAPQENHERIRADSKLVLALFDANNESMCNCTDRFLMLFTYLALYEDERSVTKQYDSQELDKVHMGIVREMSPWEDDFFTPAVFALRCVSSQKHCREIMWQRHGRSAGKWNGMNGRERDIAIEPLVPLVLSAWTYALDCVLPDAAVHAVAALAAFAKDEAPRKAMDRELGRISALLERSAALHNAATIRQFGQTLLQRVCGSVFPQQAGAALFTVLKETHPPQAALQLLDAGKADIYVVDERGMTPLMHSCVSPALTPVTRRILDKLASDTNPARKKAYLDARAGGVSTGAGEADLSGYSALWISLMHSRPEQAEMLLQAGASANLSAVKNKSALVLAMCFLMPLCRVLLRHGADPGTPEQFSSQVFAVMGITGKDDEYDDDAATEEEEDEAHHMDLLKLLADEERVLPAHSRMPTVPVANGQHHLVRADVLDPFTLLAYAARGDLPLGVTRRWLELGGNPDAGFQVALLTGRCADAELFLQAGANPNYVLLEAGEVLQRYKPSSSSSSDRPATVRLAIKAGWQPSRAALAKAVELGDVGVVKLLLQADPSIKDSTSSMCALAKRLGHEALLPYLASEDSNGVGEFDEGDGFGFAFTMCAHCRRRGGGGVLHACAGCVMVAYCDEECQRAHWKQQHSKVCKKKREMDAQRQH